jgi:PIN domain nuclease of toxin-antitoxin system
MLAAVADTHTALWYLYGDKRLSSTAKSLIDRAGAVGRQIGISSITLAELVYLIEKNRLPPNVYAGLEAALGDPAHAFTEIACTKSVIRALRTIPRAEIPDMPDRLIAATAASLNVPLISRDGRIRASAVHTIW